MEARIKQEEKPAIRSIQIHVELKQIRKKHTIDVDIMETVRSIKARVQRLEAIPLEKIDLIYGGDPLDDGATLSSYKIQCGSTIYVICPATDAMRLSVYMKRAEKTIELKVKGWYTAENVKCMIESMVGIAADEQRLYAGSLINNEITMDHLWRNSWTLLKLFYGIYIFLEKPNSKTKLEVERFDTIANIRKEAANVEDCQFVYKGMVLEDSHTLADYGIGNGDSIVCKFSRAVHPQRSTQNLNGFESEFTVAISSFLGRVGY